MSVDLHWRLEPERAPFGNLQRGFAAELGDPLWCLGRQWQMGEHQGENASTPLRLEISASETPIAPPADRAAQDPRVVPAEAIIEGGPDDWWTLGRRIAIGLRAVSEGLAPPIGAGTDRALVLIDLPEPYRGLAGKIYDGRALARSPLFDIRAIVPPIAPAGDHWVGDELAYRASFPCADTTLRADRHDGGDVDWWTVDAARPLVATADPIDHTALPSRFTYPGAPLPRFWQIEDRHVDIGAFAPDRSHFATLLLIDLIASHSDDWFTFPFLTRPGHVLRLHRVTVIDSFGDRWPDAGSPWQPTPPDEWALFRIRGLDPPFAAGDPHVVRTLPIWPTAATPLAGPSIDEVVLGVDEDANLLWAVEHRVGGSETTQPMPKPPLPGATGAPFTYRPSSAVPFHWHPYEIEAVNTDPAVPGRRRFVQARLADLHTDAASDLRPAPRADVLNVEVGIHEIEPGTIPTTGLRLDQRFMLARGTDGRPVLWVQRQRLPLLGPPSHALRFDVAGSTPKKPAARADQPPLPQPGTSPPPDDPLVSMVRPTGDDAAPHLTPNREPIGDAPPDRLFDPAELPALTAAPGIVDPLVSLAQSLLNGSGARANDGSMLVVDGQFGPLTGEAVTSFQTMWALNATGTVDGATWTALLPFAPVSVLLPGAAAPSGPPIARAQTILNRVGARPLLAVNGRLDDATADALRAFQTARFLAPTGGLDPATWLALAAAETDAKPIGLLRLTFEYNASWADAGDPIAKLVLAEVLDQQPRAIEAPGPFGGAHSGFWLEMWDDAGFVLYREMLPDVITLRQEIVDGTLRTYKPSAIRGTFALAVPQLPRAATLALFGPPLDADRRGDAASVIFTFDLTTI